MPRTNGLGVLRASPQQLMTVGKRVLARESYRAALILLLILNIDFFPCIWGHKTLLESAGPSPSILVTGAWAGVHSNSVHFNKTLDPGGAAWFTEPYLRFTGYEYWGAKTLPLWNPYQGLGQPYAADMQSQPFYPPALLLSLHLTPKTYNLFLLSRLFIAGFGAYLYLRLFVSFVPALTGGISAMLAGYFLLVISTPYLSVETLTPGVLFVAELLLRTPTRRTIVMFSLAITLAILGGMPESTLLLYALVYAYIAFRILFDADLRRTWRKTSVSILLATGIGLGLAAFLLVPVLEFIRHSFHSHGSWIPGLWHERFDQSIFTYIFPLLFGQPYGPTIIPQYNGDGTRNYFGIIALFLVLVALFSTVRRPVIPADRRIRQLTYFFFVAAVLVLLKRYGFPPVDAIGGLPLLKLVILIKYDEPILSVCIAMLCGFGLERIISGMASWRVQVASFIVTFLVIPTAVLLSKDLLMTELRTDHVLPGFPLIAIGVPVCLLFCLALCYIAIGNDASVGDGGNGAAGARLSACLLILLTAEMSLNYIPALYYSLGKLPDTSQNPYAGAPYVAWLKSKTENSSRVFGRGGFLAPNWASVFQLSDIRDLDALYYWKYLPFIRNFLLAPGQQPPGDDLKDRFTGGRNFDYPFTTDVQRRLLQLSSVRYLITDAPYSRPEFQLTYDGEVKVYAYDHVLPRAALFFRAEVVKDDLQILKRLTDPGFDPFQTVLLNAVQLRPDQVAQISNVNENPARPVQPATIISYTPQSVELEALLPESGILVLNDSDYPGWQASVDGRPSKILSANFIFRGVLLSAGKHRIRFSYRPRAFRLGATISLLTLTGLLVWYFGFRRFVPPDSPHGA